MIRWNEYRVKDIARQMGSGTTPSSKVERYYDSEDYHWINSGDFNDSEVYGGKQMISELAVTESSALRFYMPDTVLVAMYGASIGKVGMLKVKATVNQACCAIVPNTKKVLPYFLFYLFINSKDALISKSFGGTQPNVSQGIIANMIFCVPSLSVQQKIVDYLDEKISAIDTQVELLEKKKDAYTRLKKAMINRAVIRGLDENVKLKDSGVEWIGMIPEHWEVKRIKDVVSDIFMGVSPVYEYEIDNQNYVFGQRNNQLYGIDFEDIKHAKDDFFASRPQKEFLKYGDVLLNTLGGGSVGRAGFYDKEDNTPVITDGHVMIIRSKTYNTRYMYYYLYSRRERLEMMAIGSTNQAFFNVSDIREISLPTPFIKEQQSIVAYLDEKCAKIDAAIANIDKQTDALRRLKRSLINEVITGQRAV